jgi:hypothetical protein
MEQTLSITGDVRIMMIWTEGDLNAMAIVKESASIVTMMELTTPSWLQLVSPRDGMMAIKVIATVAVSIMMEEAIEDNGVISATPNP